MDKQLEQMPVLGDDKKILQFVPMEILSEEWAQKNHGQTLQRLKERGGLSLAEMAAIITKTDCISTQYTQLGSLAIIAKQLIAGATSSSTVKAKDERIRELETEVKIYLSVIERLRMVLYEKIRDDWEEEKSQHH